MIDLSEYLCQCNESIDRRESDMEIACVVYQDVTDKDKQEVYCNDCGSRLTKD